MIKIIVKTTQYGCGLCTPSLGLVPGAILTSVYPYMLEGGMGGNGTNMGGQG